MTAADLLEGDKVVVQAKLPRTDPGEAPFAARKVVDQTHPKVDEEEAPAPVEETPAPPVEETPAP